VRFQPRYTECDEWLSIHVSRWYPMCDEKMNWTTECTTEMHDAGATGRGDYVEVVSTDASLDERLRGSVAEVDARRLQRRFEGVAVSAISAVEERRPARFGGEVRSQHRSAVGTRPMLRVTVHDGTGSAVAVFTGRSRIRGLDAGRAVLFEGVGRRDHGQLVVVNPAYTLLA
jgi:hypothetical protein